MLNFQNLFLAVVELLLVHWLRHSTKLFNKLLTERMFFCSQVTIYHLLKLFQTEADIMLGKKNLVSECYDELVCIVSLHLNYFIMF